MGDGRREVWNPIILLDLEGGVESLPSLPGVYVLLVSIQEPLRIEIRGRSILLKPGLYLYVGSAGGSGGIRARVARHARREKKVWWHIDRVTTRRETRVEGVVFLAPPPGEEVPLGPPAESLVSRCIAGRGFEPIPGFGASDDPFSESHFFRADSGLQGAVRTAFECLRRLLDPG